MDIVGRVVTLIFNISRRFLCVYLYVYVYVDEDMDIYIYIINGKIK